MPIISVLMSAFNAEKYIEETIDSVLNQSFKNFEFIIINDGSTDTTEKKILSYKDSRIRFFNNKKNIGLTKSLNRGLKIAKAKYVARIDADDLLTKDYLKKKLEFFKKNKDIAIIGSWVEVIDQNSKKIKIIKYNLDPVIIKWSMILKNQIAHSSAFFVKDIIIKEGAYKEIYRYSQDFDLWFSVSRKNRIINIPQPIVKYRVHKNSISLDFKKSKKQRKIIKEIIFNNINYYFKIDKKDFEIFILAWKNSKILNFKSFIKIRKIYKELFKSYVKKESLTGQDLKKVLDNYRFNKNAIIKSYLKNIFL